VRSAPPPPSGVSRAEPLTARLASWLSPEAEAVRARLALGAFPFLAAAHGEFELVFAVPPSRLPALAAAARALDWHPLALGYIEEGAGLFVGDTRVDGAAIRNLLRASGGDLPRYLTSLVELGRTLA
jgi:thiamine monophosphate kinase